MRSVNRPVSLSSVGNGGGGGTSRRLDQTEQRPVQVHDVELSPFVLAEAHRVVAVRDHGVGQHVGAVVAQAPDVACPITVDVRVSQTRHVDAAIDVAADDREAVRATVLGNGSQEVRERQVVRVVGAHRSLVDRPAAVVPRRNEIDLLPRSPADVAEPEVARAPVEGEPPGIPEPVGPDLATRSGCRHERVVARDPVALTRGRVGDVDAQNAPEQRAEVLGIVPRAAVPESDVEHAVGTELDHARVVELLGLADLEDDLARGGAGGRRAGCRKRGGVASDDRASGRVCGVVDVEPPVGGVVRMEGQAEQSLFHVGARAGAGDDGAPRARAQVDERRSRGRRVLVAPDGDGAALRDHEHPAGITGIPMGVVDAGRVHGSPEAHRPCAFELDVGNARVQAREGQRGQGNPLGQPKGARRSGRRRPIVAGSRRSLGSTSARGSPYREDHENDESAPGPDAVHEGLPERGHPADGIDPQSPSPKPDPGW